MCRRFLGDRLVCHRCGARQFVGQAFPLTAKQLNLGRQAGALALQARFPLASRGWVIRRASRFYLGSIRASFILSPSASKDADTCWTMTTRLPPFAKQ